MISDTPMVFIVGSSRSGTTMMGRILNNHPSVFTFPHELHFFEQLWSQRDKDCILSHDEAVRMAARLRTIYHDGYLTQGDYRRHVDEGEDIVSRMSVPLLAHRVFEAFMQVTAAENYKVIPCDQTPRNVFYIREILNFFPRAYVINMIRDPRDVLLSQKKKWKVRFFSGKKYIPLKETFRSWVNYHPITISKLWDASIRAAGEFSNDGRVRSVYYEKLLDRPGETVRRLCEFFGLSFDKSLLEIPLIGSSIVPDQLYMKRINKGRAENWKDGGLSSSEIYLNQRITGHSMRKHSYLAAEIKPNFLKVLYYISSFPLKISLAFILNIGRMKNINETLKRRLR